MLDIIVRSIYLLGSKRALGLALGELGLEKLSFTIKSVALPLLFAPAKMVLGMRFKCATWRQTQAR